MKSSVLRACILGPYVPLRTSFKRKRVAYKLYLPSHTPNISFVQNDVMTSFSIGEYEAVIQGHKLS